MAAGERGMLGMLLGAGRGEGRGDPPFAMYWNDLVWESYAFRSVTLLLEFERVR